MPRLSITLTDSQAEALDRIATETGATKQSMIGLAISQWIRTNDTAPVWSGECVVHGPDVLSGEPSTWSIGYDEYHSRTEAMDHAQRLADAERQGEYSAGYEFVPRVTRLR